MKTPTQIASEASIMSLLRDCVVVDENHHLDVTEDFFACLTAIQQATEEGANHWRMSSVCREKDAQLRDMTDQFFKVSQENATMTDQLAARDGVIARLREALVGVSALITHGDFKNGNTHPDGHGPDEGEVMAGRMYDSIRNALDTTPATYADKLREAEKELTAMRGLLDSAYNGLLWYHGEHPEDASPADLEMHEAIRARLATERKEDGK